jgi:hypothetical protein
MQFTQISIVTLGALLQAVQADFDLYRVLTLPYPFFTSDGEYWEVYPASWTCNDVVSLPRWRVSDDVSGGNYGVRCSGDGCGRSNGTDPSDIDTVEMNFNSDDHHWSEYWPSLCFRWYCWTNVYAPLCSLLQGPWWRTSRPRRQKCGKMRAAL